MPRLLSTLLAVALFSAVSGAQVFSAKINPSPARLGGDFTMELTNATDGVVLFLDSCILKRVTEGAPASPQPNGRAGEGPACRRSG